MSSPGYVLAERTRMPGVSRIGHRFLAVSVAVIAVATLVGLWSFFIDTRTGQYIDEASRLGASAGASSVWDTLTPILDVVSVPFIVGVVIVAGLVAAARRRWLIAVQVALVVIGSNVTTQVLKHSIIERPDYGTWAPANSLPSGHTTVAASIAAALILVLPPVSRTLFTVLGGLYATLTGLATLVNQWHRFSDIVAAFLVVLAWFAIACAVSSPSTYDNPRPHGKRSHAIRITVLTLVAFGVVTGIRAWTELPELTSQFEARDSVDPMLAGSFGQLAILSVAALSFAAMLGLRHMLARGYFAEQGISGPDRPAAERRLNAIEPLGTDTLH